MVTRVVGGMAVTEDGGDGSRGAGAVVAEALGRGVYRGNRASVDSVVPAWGKGLKA